MEEGVEKIGPKEKEESTEGGGWSPTRPPVTSPWQIRFRLGLVLGLHLRLCLGLGLNLQ